MWAHATATGGCRSYCLNGRVAVHFFTYRFIMFERFHSIIVLSLSLETSKSKASGAMKLTMYNSSVYSYSLLFRFALSHASPVHSYGGYAFPSFLSFLSRGGGIILTIYRVLILSVAGIRWHNHHRLILWCADYTTTGSSAQRVCLSSSVLSYCSFACFATPFLRQLVSPAYSSISFRMFERFYYRCWEILLQMLRDFIISCYHPIMVLVFEYINLSNIECGSDHQSRRSRRL